MARTINKVELLGRVGTAPEMQYTPNGTAVTKLRLATDRPRSNGDTDTDLARRDLLVEVGGSGERVRRQGAAHLRRRTPRTEHLGGRRRPAPPPHRGPRLRGRVPRLPQRQRRERRRRGGLALLARQPTTEIDARLSPGANTTGPLPPTGGGPASVLNDNEGGRHDPEETAQADRNPFG